jgi:hypothetical protein
MRLDVLHWLVANMKPECCNLSQTCLRVRHTLSRQPYWRKAQCFQRDIPITILIHIVCWKWTLVNFYWWIDDLRHYLMKTHPETHFRHTVVPSAHFGFHPTGGVMITRVNTQRCPPRTSIGWQSHVGQIHWQMYVLLAVLFHCHRLWNASDCLILRPHVSPCDTQNENLTALPSGLVSR